MSELDWSAIVLIGAFWLFVIATWLAIWRRRKDRCDGKSALQAPGQIQELYQADGLTFSRKSEFDEALSEKDREGLPFSSGG